LEDEGDAVHEGQRVVLVTGSSRGLGEAIALEFGRAGYAVAVNSNQSVADGEDVARRIAADGAATYIRADVSNHGEAAGLVQATVEHFGRLDVLVNNVDWYVPSMFEDDTPEHWDRTVGVGLMAAIFATHSALPHLKTAGEGRIVTIVGDSGRVGLTGGAVHSAIKGALISITKSWAREFAGYGIRVNAVSPGGAFPGTKIWDDLAVHPLGSKVAGSELQGLLGAGDPRDVAYAATFLASEQARHVTGQTLSVNGGRAFPG
jgi:NAD(P)-dependent dehydrogenase (short-subunit alcohol dehydrogenase family)